MNIQRRVRTLPVALGVLMCSTLWAQTNQGAISGTVVDVSGAAVPGVAVQAKNSETGVGYKAETNGAGGFNLPQVQLGTYTVTFSHEGFAKVEKTGVSVNIAATSALNIKLSAGASDAVSVEAGAPQVESQSSEIGTSITPRIADELPLILPSAEMRTPYSFIFTAPGTVGPGTAGQGNFGFNQSGAYQTKISGGQNFAAEVLVDGASTYRQAAGETFGQISPSVEAISQFRILTSTLPAQYGRTTGGLTTFSTRGGTNDYHGHLYDIFSNEVLNANNWFNKANLATANGNATIIKNNQRTLQRQNDYGIVLGGPVRIPKVFDGRDKLFFFYSFEQYRKTQGTNVITGVPIQAQRNGDFSQFLGAPLVSGSNPVMNPCTGQQMIQGQIFDPATTRTVGGVQCRTPFGGNVIPTNRISKVAQAVLGYVPLPNLNTQLNNNYQLADNEPIVQTNQSVRVDWNLSSRHRLYASFTDRNNVNPAGSRALPTLADPNISTQYQPVYLARAGWDYTISPTLLNHFNLGYSRLPTFQTSLAVDAGFTPASLGITGTLGIGFPRFGPGEGFANFGQSTNNAQVDTTGSVFDNVIKQIGRHSLTLGIDYRYDMFSNHDTATQPGQFNFSRTQTAGANTSTDANILTDTGNQFASFLLGATSGGYLQNTGLVSLWIQHYGALYLQDDYKVLPNLTLNLGVRYDIDPPRYSRQGRQSNFDPRAINAATGTAGALVFAGTGTGRNGDRTETWADVEYGDVAPRIGFSFAPVATTALRGGYGILYAPLIASDFGNGPNVAGFSTITQPSSPDAFSPAFSLDSGFPGLVTPPNLNNAQSNFTSAPWIQKTDGKPGMVQNWSLQLQQQLASDLVFSVGYVGQHSTRLNANVRFPNTLDPKYFVLGNLLNAQLGSAQARAAGIAIPYASFPLTQTVGQALRAFPQFFALGPQGYGQPYEATGMATYHSLQATLTRQFRQGLHVQASYTWEKTLTDADSALPFQAASGTNGNHQAGAPTQTEKALSIQDIPHIFVLSYIYELPFGKGKHFLNHGGLINALLGGYQVGVIQRYQSGQPLNNPCAGGVAGDDGCFRYSFVGDHRSFINHKPNFNPYNGQDRFLAGTITPSGSNFVVTNSPLVNPNANVATTGVFQFGNAPRVLNARLFGYQQEDFSIVKRIPIHDALSAEIRGQMFNAFNRHIFGGPNDTNPTNGTNYGRVSGTIDTPRIVQFQARISF